MRFGLDSAHIQKFVENVTFFKAFSEHEKRKLTSEQNNFKQYEQGVDIFKEGDPGGSLFVILFGNISLIKTIEAETGEGRVSLKEGIEKAVGDLGVGSVFGEISLLTGRKEV